MTDFTTHLARLLAHYETLHKTPGWKDYVERRVADMAQRNPELYSDLAARFPRPSLKSFVGRRSGGR